MSDTSQLKDINGEIVSTVDIPQPKFSIDDNCHLIVTY